MSPIVSILIPALMMLGIKDWSPVGAAMPGCGTRGLRLQKKTNAPSQGQRGLISVPEPPQGPASHHHLPLTLQQCALIFRHRKLPLLQGSSQDRAIRFPWSGLSQGCESPPGTETPSPALQAQVCGGVLTVRENACLTVIVFREKVRRPHAPLATYRIVLAS